ncbi:hypothetical protein [Gemmatimonas sp.]|uniref:hypothetical protein n=1 Tax=Gemmatimonas sp. TaxID=1962908 RepID=UPI003983109D
MKLLFVDQTFSFELLRTASYGLYGGSELGEMLAMAKRIREGDFESWHAEWQRRVAFEPRIKTLIIHVVLFDFWATQSTTKPAIGLLSRWKSPRGLKTVLDVAARFDSELRCTAQPSLRPAGATRHALGRAQGAHRGACVHGGRRRRGTLSDGQYHAAAPSVV